MELHSNDMGSSIFDARTDHGHAPKIDVANLDDYRQGQQDTQITSTLQLDDINQTSGVNTHLSILNIEDDEEGDEEYVLSPHDTPSMRSADIRMQSVDEDYRPKSGVCCYYNLARTSILERILDNLCGAPNAVDMTDGYRGAVQDNILQVLGCASHPTEDELRWDKSTILHRFHAETPVVVARAQRKNLKQRATLLDRLRQERQLPKSYAGLAGSPTSVALRSRSLDQWGRPIKLNVADDGYDSDPEFTDLKLPPPTCVSADPTGENYETLRPSSVQETLNMVWTLTYHSPKGVVHTPVVARCWMERGTLIDNNSRMLEPTFMWRPSIHTGTVFEEPPNAIRLLNICRIKSVDKPLDRSHYPFAQAPCCFWIKTADGTNYLFQASSSDERNVIMTRWKHCVARFAALAVLEEMDAIADEFFLPAVYSR
ncbi:hypothetical protein MPSEU_000594600 [Mayamaea pseudoterrestris]|nr:hypothetical protein MPSEU_000594600 [Mayamaea pseudoterrestris]